MNLQLVIELRSPLHFYFTDKTA